MRNQQLIFDTMDEIKLITVPMRNSDFAKSSNLLIEIEQFDWSIKMLSVLLNELDDWIIDPNNGSRNQKRADGTYYFFFRFILKSDPYDYIILNIQNDKNIVKFSKSITENWPKEDYHAFYTKKYFYLQLKSKGTHAILRNSPILFYSEDDFSQVFKYFCSSFIDNNLASNSTDTSHIYDYYNSFIKNTLYEPIDFETLVKKTEGYMFFHLVKHNNTKKKLDTFKIKDDIYYILGGTYISPFACSLVENKIVDGMMLDTTFSIIQNYYTSIPTLVIQNAGVPIGFTFGLTENEKIYSEFFKRFENLFGFKIPSNPTKELHCLLSLKSKALSIFHV